MQKTVSRTQIHAELWVKRWNSNLVHHVAVLTHDEHSHKATLSESTLTPPRLWTMSNHSRAFSIVSAHTDLELCAVADLLSPAVSHTHSLAVEQEAATVALDDDDDDFLDASIKSCDQRQEKASITPYLLLEWEEPLSPLHASYSPPSPFTPSDSESEPFLEDSHSHPHTPLLSTFPTYHLPRRGRARKQSSADVSASDSDTPSLSSSTTSASSLRSQSYSRPRSLETLKTPLDYISPLHSLTIIEEQGNQARASRRVSQSSGSIIFAPIDPPAGQDGPAQTLRTIEIRAKNRNIENLRVNVPPISAPFPLLTHSPSSPTLEPSLYSVPNRQGTPTPRPGVGGKLSLTRIISPVSKSSKHSECGSETSTSPTISAPVTKSKKEDAKEEKTRKAEAKRMKKAEQKAKLERLAEELKERQRRKGLAPEKGSVHSNRSGGRARHWDSDIAMYDGLGNAM